MVICRPRIGAINRATNQTYQTHLTYQPSSLTRPNRRAVERQTAGEVGELAPQHQPPAMQPRLQRLQVESQQVAGLFGRQSAQVAQDHRRAVVAGAGTDRVGEPRAQLRAQDLFIRQRLPIGHIVGPRLGARIARRGVGGRFPPRVRRVAAAGGTWPH